MCGRYRFAPDPPQGRLQEIIEEINRRGMSVRTGEITPGVEVAAIAWEGGERAVAMLWGARSHAGLVINARAETAREKIMFRQSARMRRHLLPLDGFYEWKHGPGGGKGTKYYIHGEEDGLLFMGGLAVPTAEGLRMVVLTRPADEQIAPLHDRMPLFIGEELRDAWLRGGDSSWDAALEAQPPRLSLEAAEPEQISFF